MVRNLTKTSRERENPCEAKKCTTERNRTNQFSESFNGLVLISEIPVPLVQGLIDTNDLAEETQLSAISGSVIRLSLGSSYQMS